MELQVWVNQKEIKAEVAPDMVLLDFLRAQGFYSVKRGCETTNCGLCTVLMNDVPVLSCSILAIRANGAQIFTLEGVEEEAIKFGSYLADQGGEQCGFCSPGFIMNVIAMSRELVDPSDDEIRHYLAGNLCRCTGYQSQMRAIKQYLSAKKGEHSEYNEN